MAQNRGRCPLLGTPRTDPDRPDSSTLRPRASSIHGHIRLQRFMTCATNMAAFRKTRRSPTDIDDPTGVPVDQGVPATVTRTGSLIIQPYPQHVLLTCIPRRGAKRLVNLFRISDKPLAHRRASAGYKMGHQLSQARAESCGLHGRAMFQTRLYAERCDRRCNRGQRRGHPSTSPFAFSSPAD
jgi:hypothetical protein